MVTSCCLRLSCIAFVMRSTCSSLAFLAASMTSLSSFACSSCCFCINKRSSFVRRLFSSSCSLRYSSSSCFCLAIPSSYATCCSCMCRFWRSSSCRMRSISLACASCSCAALCLASSAALKLSSRLSSARRIAARMLRFSSIQADAHMSAMSGKRVASAVSWKVPKAAATAASKAARPPLQENRPWRSPAETESNADCKQAWHWLFAAALLASSHTLNSSSRAAVKLSSFPSTTLHAILLWSCRHC
mmetsp:Transcript_47513/g.110777  ORF Transcript_47513/g.110777 Transcript_47513/m.110777 type:complete len:246 (+) Transcript_47513:433-1170(+)